MANVWRKYKNYSPVLAFSLTLSSLFFGSLLVIGTTAAAASDAPQPASATNAAAKSAVSAGDAKGAATTTGNSTATAGRPAPAATGSASGSANGSAINSAAGQAAATTGGSKPAGTSQPLMAPVRTVQEGPDPVKTCMAYLSEEPPPPKQKKRKRPVLFVGKALASELKTDAKGMLEDTAFVFSAKDFDPYSRETPTDKPYTALELTLVDGSNASVIKYPDGSAKIVGSYLDNTVIAPNGKDTFIVAYPNGVRSRMVRASSIEYKIFRPDNTITYLKKEDSGEWQVSNNKLGFMGTAEPDRENLQFELHSKVF